VTPEQEQFLREWAATLDRHAGDIGADTDRLVEKVDRLADAVATSDVRAAWNRIASRAETLVQKSGGLSREEAVVRVLANDPGLYDRYVEELHKAAYETNGTRQEDVSAARDLVRWATERLALGADPDAYRNELLSNPQMQEAVRVVQEADARKAREEREREKAERERDVRKAAATKKPPAGRPEPVEDVWPLPRRELLRKRHIEIEGDWPVSFAVD
jgi:hypothetical protein